MHRPASKDAISHSTEMRHPLRAVIPPVQSQHNKQNKQVTGSQPLKQHENTQCSGEPLDDSPLSIRGVVPTQRDKQVLSKLRLASAMALSRCVVSRYATAWAESLEGAMSEIPEGVDRNSELKQLLQLWTTAHEAGSFLLAICFSPVRTCRLSVLPMMKDDNPPTQRTTLRVYPVLSCKNKHTLC